MDSKTVWGWGWRSQQRSPAQGPWVDPVLTGEHPTPQPRTPTFAPSSSRDQHYLVSPHPSLWQEPEPGTQINPQTPWWELDLPDHTRTYRPEKPYSGLAGVSTILLTSLWIVSLPAKRSRLTCPEEPPSPRNQVKHPLGGFTEVSPLLAELQAKRMTSALSIFKKMHGAFN